MSQALELARRAPAKPSSPARLMTTNCRSAPYALGRAGRLADHRHDAAACLAGALGHELLDPVPERRQARRGEDRELVASRQRGLPQRRPELEAGVLLGRETAGIGHDARPLQQRLEIDTVHGGRQQAKDGEGAVAAADVRRPLDDGPEALGASEVGKRRPGVGDGNEVEGRGVRAHGRVEGIRLGGRSGLAADAEDGARRLGPFPEAADRIRVRRVEDAQLLPIRVAEEMAEELRCEAAAPHAEHRGPRVAVVAHLACDPLELTDAFAHPLGQPQPAEPGGGLAGRGPEAPVARPEAFRDPLLGPKGEACRHRGGQRG